MQIINWYPGHIAKAQRKLKENLKLVDLVIEMADSRIPVSSHLNFVDQLLQGKDHMMVINKADLADRQKLSEAIDYWQNKDKDVISVTLFDQKDIFRLRNNLKKYQKKLSERLKARGRLSRSLRIMIIGIPNIGKSTLINRLVVKKSARTGDKPGVTRNTQWVRIGENIELLDTPGIIVPKFEDQKFALKLVMIGSISMEAYEPIETAREIIRHLKINNPDFYQKFGEEFSIENYARERNFLKSGAELDIERTARTFIKDLRDGKLGYYFYD